MVNGMVRAVIVKDLSRLGREYLEVGKLTGTGVPQLRCALYCHQRQCGQPLWRERL